MLKTIIYFFISGLFDE